MKLTKKLLGFLNRVFDKDPVQFLALRLSYDGGMTWKVEDGVLSTVVSDGTGKNLTVNLGDYTVTGLVGYLAAQPGYSTPHIDGSENATLSARVLLDGAGDIAKSNGDHLYGYTNVLFAILEAQAVELKAAEEAGRQALRQLTTKTAEDAWLDELGSYFKVPRLAGEVDQQYSPRMVAEILRPRGNNVAMEAAISHFTGQVTKVVDVTLYGQSAPLHNATKLRDGTARHNSLAIPIYGLFDVEYGYDLLNGSDVTAFRQVLSDLIGRLRDAGTHMRSLLLRSSAISDDFPYTPTDGSGVQAISVSMVHEETLPVPTDTYASLVTLSSLGDTLPVDPVEDVGLLVAYDYRHEGLRLRNGIIKRLGGEILAESL